MAAPTYEDLAVAFRHGNFAPLYFLYGTEDLLLSELQALLVQHAVDPATRDFNFDLFHGPDAQAQQVLAACAALPVMAQRRVVLVRQFEKLADNRAFQAYAQQPNPHAVVCLVCAGKPNLSQHPYRALKQHAAWFEAKPLKGRELAGWAVERARVAGLRLSGGAAQRLAEVSGGSLRTVAGEVDKLAAYVGQRGEITEADVVEAAGHSAEVNPFTLQQALGAGDAHRALAIVDALLAQASNRRSEAIALVAILAGYFVKLRKLAGCGGQGSEGELASLMGVPPFYVKEYRRALGKLGAGAVSLALEALLAADAELKGGSARDERLVLWLLVRRILPAPP